MDPAWHSLSEWNILLVTEVTLQKFAPNFSLITEKLLPLNSRDYFRSSANETDLTLHFEMRHTWLSFCLSFFFSYFAYLQYLCINEPKMELFFFFLTEWMIKTRKITQNTLYFILCKITSWSLYLFRGWHTLHHNNSLKVRLVRPSHRSAGFITQLYTFFFLNVSISAKCLRWPLFSNNRRFGILNLKHISVVSDWTISGHSDSWLLNCTYITVF